MYGKLKITADIEVLTGLHIGGSRVYSAIGAVNAPVIRDAATQLPIIPGSSLKGKLRTLLVRKLKRSVMIDTEKVKSVKTDKEDDTEEVMRLFGSPQRDNGMYISRLQFFDCFLKNADDLYNIGLTEVKTENTIDRYTAKANPRQIERVKKGAVFGFKLIYDVYCDCEEVKEDFQNIADGFKLLQMDYLGGNGTRGYGKIAFNNFKIEPLCISKTSEVSGKLDELRDIITGAEKHEPLFI